MKTFEVYSRWGMSIVKADRIERHSKNDSPTKILFFVQDEIVAEFYCESLAGGIEVREKEMNE